MLPSLPFLLSFPQGICVLLGSASRSVASRHPDTNPNAVILSEAAARPPMRSRRAPKVCALERRLMLSTAKPRGRNDANDREQVESVGVLRLRCASLRMTFLWRGSPPFTLHSSLFPLLSPLATHHSSLTILAAPC